MFEETMRNFTAVEYDIMDVEPETRTLFYKDFNKFKNSMKHIDKRVASVISQSFEDNTTFSSRFKLFEMFDELIYRTKIEEEIRSTLVCSTLTKRTSSPATASS